VTAPVSACVARCGRKSRHDGDTLSIRVIAGRFKRRTLVTPTGLATRPTAARAREALFSVLGALEGASVLDLYAGSGALGIEALSRGARQAVLVERERGALACIQKNIDALGIASECRALAVPVERLSHERLSAFGPFDLVFCDPPWDDLGAALLALPALGACLAPSARLVLEHPHKVRPDLPGFSCADRRHWGDTGVSIFVANASSEPDVGPVR
jgi:16S rRNA (guanine966-N2)-methyltransferase